MMCDLSVLQWSLFFLHCHGVILVHGELSQGFSKCLDFFYKSSPPQGFEGAGHQAICQRFRNQYHFATLYDRGNRAPLYSAYILRLADGKRPDDPWMYEPQLVSSGANPEMKRLRDPDIDQNITESQAVLQDYKNSGYTKGHLNPSMHQETKDNRMATFTLTNIVPQRADSNSGPWNLLETEVLKQFKEVCIGPMYIITGVLPYKDGGHRINDRVLIPEYMWSSFCCPNYQKILPDAKHFPTYAAIGRNDPNSDQEIVPKVNAMGYDVRQMSVKELEEILTKRLASPIQLFQDQCKP